ncbi:MAG: uracil phosphoribosyltransferase [Ruminococcus sp.]|nr:uracil phosphoribosyltransferase [Ruminococcus sp.]
MSKVTIFDHPLIQHKLSILRDENTGTKEFRELISEISMLMCYEATRDLPLEDVEIKTPMAPMVAKRIAGRKLAFVPILRAGCGMLDAMLTLVPSAKVGHIGLYRDEETHKPVEYYNKLPGDVEERDVFVLDPMLATGGSAVDAISIIKRSHPRSIKFLCIIAAPEGIEVLTKEHPDVEIFCAAKDEKLNENCYILPGLGDAGDRIYGTDVVGEVSVDKRGSTVKLHSKIK